MPQDNFEELYGSEQVTATNKASSPDLRVRTRKNYRTRATPFAVIHEDTNSKDEANNDEHDYW